MTDRSLSFDDQARLFTDLKDRAAVVRRGL
jgi:hypothetical protein